MRTPCRCSHSRAGAESVVTRGTEKIAPRLARMTLGLYSSTKGSHTITASTPAASAVRSIAPRLPGFSTVSNTRSKGFSDKGERLLPESAKSGVDYLAEVCTAWEREADRAGELGVRVVKLRIGVVLGAGGALKQMLPPFKFGLGGPIGSGAHWMSWIHIDDLCGMVLHALRDETVSGAVNGVAPGACTNKDFSKALGRALSRPAFFPVPPFMLKLMFGEVATVLTSSQRCVPERALKSGYAFKYADVDGALRAILS